MTRKSLNNRIDKLLKKKVKSFGTWGKVTVNDLEEICEIFCGIIELKYQPDADGEYPVDFMINDRTTCEPLQFTPLPYPPKYEGGDPGPEDMLKDMVRFDMAQYNLELAAGLLRETMGPMRKYMADFRDNTLEMLAEDVVEKKKSKNPVDRVG